MENKKINVAELLKDCPKGMELDCVLWDNVTFHSVDYSNYSFPIRISVNGFINFLTKEGYYHNNTRISSKCIIFPKGKTTWEGFVPPCEFKDGGVVAVDATNEDYVQLFIFKKYTNAKAGRAHCYLMLDSEGLYSEGDYYVTRHATEEEKERLFRAIESKGFKWNPETKTLDKLIVPKFKVGEIIKNIKSDVRGTIARITDSTVYISSEGGDFNFSLTLQDDWELVPNKFDINTLKPYDKVLVRSVDSEKWKCDFFSNYEETYLCKFKCVGCNYQYCIPYKGNGHLLGTTDDCSEYYKTWEG